MDSFPINPVDLGVIVILLLSGVIAFYRGFVRETLAVGVWVGAAFATLYGFEPAQPFLRHYLSPLLLADAVTGVAIFIVALIILTLIGNQISAKVQKSQMGALDRSLGFVFGLFRGAVVAAIAYLVMAWVMPPQDRPDWFRSARTLPLLADGGDLLLKLLPESAQNRSREAIGAGADQARDAAERARALERATRPLMQPTPPSPQPSDTDSRGETGYKSDERRALDGLIRGSQEK